uniref:PKD_channel domain-containing protein n=3 Tax=Mesocestoides corti TaxID=53468 RepID=A0A5K3EJ61_MESCO
MSGFYLSATVDVMPRRRKTPLSKTTIHRVGVFQPLNQSFPSTPNHSSQSLMNQPLLTDDLDRQFETASITEMDESSCLRNELSYFFLSSLERWKQSGDISYTMVVQFLKLVIVTSQLLLFGSLSSTRISYGERAELSFKHMYLLDWDPQYETLPYPPSTGIYSVYSREQLYSSVGFALREFNATELTSLNGYSFTEAGRSVRVCTAQFEPSAASLSDSDAVKVCRNLDLVNISKSALIDGDHTKRLLDSRGLSVDFARFQSLSLYFSLNSPPIHHTDWDMSVECFQFDIEITFDNSGQTGQVMVRLQSSVLEILCSAQHSGESGASSIQSFPGVSGTAPVLRRVVHLVVDLMAFNVALVSLGLCIASISHAVRLWKRTRHFFAAHYGMQLTGVFFEFVNPWLFLVLKSDALIIAGSISKLVHNRNILEAYRELSYLLGLGTLLVWISVLRYAEFSSQTHLLLRTIKRSVPGLLRFCACALILYFAFVLSAWVILGPFNVKFRTFTSSLECLFSLINGDDMYVTFSIIDRTKGLGIFLFSRIFLYTFITLFIYAVLNIFVTIIFEAYEDVKDNDDDDKHSPLWHFISQNKPPRLSVETQVDDCGMARANSRCETPEPAAPSALSRQHSPAPPEAPPAATSCARHDDKAECTGHGC